MITVVINGQNYNYPEVGDTDWGSIATLAFDAITKTTLQPVKDLNDPSVVNDFTLYNDIDFGPTHGLRVVFIQSRSNNPAATGVFRLAKDELVAWRNEDNDGDNTISFDADGDLIVNGVKVTLHGQIVNDDIAAGAGIEESKLALDHSTQSLYDNIENHKSDTANPHLTNLVNLVDTTIVTPADNDTLLYDGNDSKWKNIPNTVSNVKDVTISSIADGDVLVYDSNDSDWKNSDVVSSHVANTSNPHSVTKAQILTGDLIVNADVDASAAIAESKLALDYSTSSLNTAITSHTGNTNNPHSTSVSNLTDTTITSANSGDVLSYDGSKWINSPSTSSSLSGLSDTDITTPANGDVLVYNNVTTKWENSDELSTVSTTVSSHVSNTSNPHSTNVSNLTDTTLSGLNYGDRLTYDSNTSKWFNQPNTLGALIDTGISSEQNGDALVYDGIQWINQENSVENLTNTNISNKADGDVLVYDSNSADWINQANTVSNLTDTTITSVSDKDTLVYDGNSSKWVNVENSIDNLSNVDIDSNTETENDVLVFNDQTLKWENSQIMVNHIGNTANPHLTTVAKLTDANITTPSDKQLLQYDYANSQWVNSSDVWNRIEINEIAYVSSTPQGRSLETDPDDGLSKIIMQATDNRHQYLTATDGYNIKLPSIGVKAGEEFTFSFSLDGAFPTTSMRFYAGTNALGYAHIGNFDYIYTSLVDNPSSSTGWAFKSALRKNRLLYNTASASLSCTQNARVLGQSGTLFTAFAGIWDVSFQTTVTYGGTVGSTEPWVSYVVMEGSPRELVVARGSTDIIGYGYTISIPRNRSTTIADNNTVSFDASLARNITKTGYSPIVKRTANIRTQNSFYNTASTATVYWLNYLSFTLVEPIVTASIT